jgi:hypothetical protein
MVVVYNSNDEIPSNTYWEFWLKNVGLNCFRIYIHWSNVKKKIVEKDLNLIIHAPFIIWWKVWDFFFKKNLLQYLKKFKVCSNYIWSRDLMFCNTYILLCHFVCLSFRVKVFLWQNKDLFVFGLGSKLGTNQTSQPSTPLSPFNMA